MSDLPTQAPAEPGHLAEPGTTASSSFASPIALLLLWEVLARIGVI